MTSSSLTVFNLLDEPWIPVRLAGGRVEELGLKAVLARAGEIEALAETSPPNLVALHRLLLAIVHRALCAGVGRWGLADRVRWWGEGLPAGALESYLESWRESFWLIHPERPFLQAAVLDRLDETRDRVKPWTQIALDSANGNAPVVFDHAVDTQPRPVPAAVALRHLLGFLQFTPGGLVKVLRGSDKAGPLVNTAAVLPTGANLHQTLLLGLHPWREAISPNDLPAWEQPVAQLADLLADPRLATGPCDRYTRQSRAVLLLPCETGGGLGVRDIRFAAGRALLEDEAAPDPMSSYRAGTQGLVRLNFAEGKAVWRDLGALLPDPSHEKARPAAVLDWAVSLRMALGDVDGDQPVLLAGLTSDQAKLIRWRCEHVRLPVMALERADVAQLVREALQQAESLYRDLRQIVSHMLAQTLPESQRKETQERAREVIGRWPLATTFFPCAERGLPAWLACLGRNDIDAADRLWQRTLLQAAEALWQTAVTLLGTSTAALRALASHQGRYLAVLKPLRAAVAPASSSLSSSTQKVDP